MPDWTHVSNSQRLDKAAETTAATCIQNLSNWAHAVDEIKTWPEYTPQPLHSMPNTAAQLKIANLFVKDESERFGTGLGSFKALGAPYAVFRILADEVLAKTGIRPTSTELRAGKYRAITERVTVCVATDGNQGRGLAYGARIFGCRCVDYIHGHVSAGREEAMKALGAIVIRIDGEYEASVERAKEDARMNGWHFVSSTSWSDFDNGIPQNVMNAYMVVVEEALNMVPAVEDISHVFVCGGVGSIAAAVFLGFVLRYQSLRGAGAPVLPRFVVVEPKEADCLLQSAQQGTPTQSEGSLRTLMAGLACRAPSPAAWKVLAWLVSDFVSVPDAVAVEGMKALANAAYGDVPVVCGESSAANMGVLLQAGSDDALREKLGLTSSSQVMIFNLEGATDPKMFEELVGKSAEAVFEAKSAFYK
ncbi:tryptophan synthase beta subunit-like PLP-dependent enzyme [Aspergillus sclerotiicarbonarius CBS 121057]|uniref:Tryptophan synthase beta subunit-like PLP-dependent enzyme n=1 Tax=Aspergillus sclerotiicarbonarius (strain CBS 121057 / IBT 28362) TaxID=1448318 RepID=A0A319EVF7_ASPSB|nr:tryptophan synthase beta subunit-like PLP-dependent enzyme [Aspergillus sclerotiicarbonarius CBS 121057]